MWLADGWLMVTISIVNGAVCYYKWTECYRYILHLVAVGSVGDYM